MTKEGRLTPYIKNSWVDGSGGGTPINAACRGVIETGIYDPHRMPTPLRTLGASPARRPASIRSSQRLSSRPTRRDSAVLLFGVLGQSRSPTPSSTRLATGPPKFGMTRIST
jgi:hypothetical protein